MGETPGSVVTLLCSGMHFFNAEKRIADCVLEDTAGVAAMTSAELAHCSSTSEATVTRFCKKLGFENYRAFQLALARDVMERQPLEISNEVQLDNIPQSLQNILSNKIDEMSATINGIRKICSVCWNCCRMRSWCRSPRWATPSRWRWMRPSSSTSWGCGASPVRSRRRTRRSRSPLHRRTCCC